MNALFFSPSDWPVMLSRMVLALFIGGAIGLNRQRPGRPAGLRTFMIVSLGAALFVMLPLQIGMVGDLTDDAPTRNEVTYSAALNATARIAQGVATGVGFLGAGVILQQHRRDRDRTEVRGLTTAATIWLAGGLGAAAGCGLWQMSLIGTALTLVVLSTVKKLEKIERD